MATRRKPILIPTEVPGIFKNRAGVLVDEDGIALGFNEVKQKDRDHWRTVLETDLEQPADLLKAVAMDPTMPLHIRMKAAVRAAPFFSPKLVSVAGTPGAPPISFEQLRALPQKDLDNLEKALLAAEEIMRKAGVQND